VLTDFQENKVILAHLAEMENQDPQPLMNQEIVEFLEKWA